MRQDKLYDNYISLGNNCEAGFQIRRVLGYDRSSFFNWNITPVSALLSLLESDFLGILEANNLRHREHDLFEDRSHNYALHAEFSFPNINGDGLFLTKLTSLREKSEYLVSKFRQLSHYGQTAFFYRTDEVQNLHQNMLNVADALTRYVPSDQFDLIVAVSANILEGSYNQGNVYFRPLMRLAPAWEAHDGHVSSWDKIFAEFPHRGGLRLSGR